MEKRIGWVKSWVKSSNTELSEALARKIEERMGWEKTVLKSW
jgi:hypothetical protein